MRPYKITRPVTCISCNKSFEGESIEREVEKIMAGGAQFSTLGAPIYTPKKDGVWPSTNIRTDRFEIAQNAMDAVHEQRFKNKPWEKEPSNSEPNGTENAGGE